MGAFFDSIQIKSDSKKVEDLKKQIIEAITLLNAQDEYTLVDDVESADKSVIIVTSIDTPWISVYDEETIMNIQLLYRLGSELSKGEDTIALTALVSDSDYVDLRYNENGYFVDNLSNTADLFNLKTNRPEIWSKLINKPFEEIESLWNSKNVFVESFLEKLGLLADIPGERLIASYHDISEQDIISKTTLHFAKKKKEKDLVVAPVMFERLVRAGTTKCKINETQNLQWMMTNLGESSVGLEIILTGDALGNLTVTPLTAKISYHDKEKYSNEYNCDFIETKDTAGDKLLYTIIDDFQIPQSKIPSSKIKNWHNDAAELHKTTMIVEIDFKANKIGNSDLKLFIVPLANRQGFYYERLEFSIKK